MVTDSYLINQLLWPVPDDGGEIILIQKTADLWNIVQIKDQQNQTFSKTKLDSNAKLVQNQF